MMNVAINNMPESAAHRKWIVVRAVDGDVWFYDAWAYDHEADAHTQAREINGFVVENTDWLKDVFKGVVISH